VIGVSALRPSHPMGAPRESKYLGRHGAALWTPSIWTVTALHLIVGGATNLAAALSLVVPAFTPNRDAYRCRHRDHGNGDRDRRSSARARVPASTRRDRASDDRAVLPDRGTISIVWLGVAGHPIVSQIGEAVRFAPALLLGAVLSKVADRYLNDAALRRFVMLFAAVSSCVLIARGRGARASSSVAIWTGDGGGTINCPSFR